MSIKWMISGRQIVFKNVNVRYFSKKLQTNPVEELKENNDNNNEKNDQKQMVPSMPSKSFDISSLPKDTKDNFLIEFNKKLPTYDQLFEYKIQEKDFNKKKSFLNDLLSTDFKAKLTKKYELSYDEFKQYIRNYIYKEDIRTQQYQIKRHGILGPDLAAAHFIVSRGGRVRFKHQPEIWTSDLKLLPVTYEKRYKLLSIDGSDLNLIYEGLDNMILLNELEELNLSGNNKLDDWSCDKLARLFRNSKCLYYLNLSNIPRITHRGVEALHKIKSLKALIIKDTNVSKYPFIELLILMFNDVNPECKIIYK